MFLRKSEASDVTSSKLPEESNILSQNLCGKGLISPKQVQFLCTLNLIFLTRTEQSSKVVHSKLFKPGATDLQI